MLKLRYQLAWAKARTSKRGMLFFGLLTLFLLYMVLASANSGISLALFAQRFGRVAVVVQIALAFIYFGGISISITLGRGPHSAFSERTLRHYPLTSLQRKFIRHLTGLLDPVWGCCLATGLGLVIALAVTDHLPLINGMIAILVLVVAGYVTSAALLTLVERVLSSVVGTTLFTFLVFFFLSGMTWILSNHKGSEIFDSSFFLFTPPGLAASMMLHAGISFFLQRFALLLIWCGLLWILLDSAERLRSGGNRTESTNNAAQLSSFKFGIAGQGSFALIQRSLIYHLRCNRVRFGLAITIPLLFFYNQWMGSKQGVAGATFGSLAAFFLIGLCATRAITLNQFGYDGPGFKRYLFSPVSLKKVLFCNSMVSVLVGWMLIIPTLAVFKLGGVITLDPRWIALLVCSAMTGGFFFNAAGIWTSIFAPRSVVFNKIAGNDMSLAGSIVMFAGFLASFGAAYWFAEQVQFRSLLNHWFYGIAAVVLAVAIYAGSIIFAGPLLRKRRVELTGTVTVTA
jgi:hypothetical protein